MDDHLDESRYDVIVVGTGITESILAGALSRLGKKVLHLDAMPFYGGDHATYPVGDALKEALLPTSSSEVDEARVEAARRVAEGAAVHVDAVGRPVIRDGLPCERGAWHRAATAHRVPAQTASFTGVRFQERLPAARPKLSPETSSSEAEGQGDGAGDAGRAASESKAMGGEAAAGGEAHLAGWEELAERGRDFNVDLIPKLSLSAGPLVASLLKSGVGRYLEFMPLQSTFIHLPANGGGLERVPMSKGEIFQSKGISPVEKRLLMKFMQKCLTMGGVGQAAEGSWGVTGVGVSENEQLGFQRAVGHVGAAREGDAGGGGKTFGELMGEEKLTKTLESFVLHAIAMCDGGCSAEEGAGRVQEYARSLGRYSDTPFLATYYGTAEIPQAFCRLAAVYGATYVLRRAPAYLLIDAATGVCSGIICDRGQRLTAPAVVLSQRYAPASLAPPPSRAGVSRCVCIVDAPLIEGQTIALCVLPPGACGNTGPVRVLQLDYTSQACPRGTYVWHLWCPEGDGDLEKALSLLRGAAPHAGVHWCAFYDQPRREGAQPTPGVFVTGSPSAEVDGGDAVMEAEALFRSIAGPDAEWLERMPEPEVVDDEWGGGGVTGTVHLGTPKNSAGGGLAESGHGADAERAGEDAEGKASGDVVGESGG